MESPLLLINKEIEKIRRLQKEALKIKESLKKLKRLIERDTDS